MTNFILTKDQLAQLIPENPDIDEWYQAMADCLPNYDINTPRRIAAFIGQCSHESMEFTRLRENLNYRAESLMRVWPRRFPTLEIAQKYAHDQEAIANRAYADRMGNGPESSGDGWKFCGRGLIQLTGHDNYQKFAESAEMNIDDVPAYLETFQGAVHSACWYWNTGDLNQLADEDNIEEISRCVNGGTIGLEDRIKKYREALTVLGA